MLEPDAELTCADGARCALWWQRPSPIVLGRPSGTATDQTGDRQGPGRSLDGVAVGRIGRLQAPTAAAAGHLLRAACDELRRQGCGAVLAPMEASTWGAYRVLEPGQPPAPAFAGEPALDPCWYSWLAAAGFGPWLRYCSSLCTDLDLRRPGGRPLGALRIEALEPATALHLQAPLRRLVLDGFRRQPLFQPLPGSAFSHLALPWLERLDPRFSLGAFDGDDLVGLLLAHGEGSSSKPRVVVRTLVVRPGRAWAGLGRHLLERCHRQAAAAGCQAVIHALMLDPGPSRALSRPYARPFRRYALMGRSLAGWPEAAMPSARAEPDPGGWRFWIDRGGTFTDLVGRAPDGSLVVRKVLSRSPGRSPADGDSPAGKDPAVAALRQVLHLPPHQPLPPGLVEEVRLGTTVATNALLERQVAPVLLLVNRGLGDVPFIGEQHRPDLFALRIQRPEPLPMRVLEVGGRLAADGRVLQPLEWDGELEAALRAAHADGLRSVAVALLHAVANPEPERQLGARLERLGFGPVLLSHRCGGLPRLLPRLHTTLVEAAVRPVLRRYLDQVSSALGASTRLRVLTSAALLQPPAQLLAKDTILSGPAGGLVGAVAVARAAGLGDRPIIGFDMGGTSTDVFHLPAPEPSPSDPPAAAAPLDLELQEETSVAGLRLQAPCLPIHTVAAGGGSIIRLEGGRLQVGPASAGADPGPACYRQGGPLTITDANLLLGRLPAGSLPAVFGPDGNLPADDNAARNGFEALAARLEKTTQAPSSSPPPPTPRTSAETLAQGARTIALERMVAAIRRISIQHGHDIRPAVLVSYGGAGGQHACALAERLGIRQVLLHPLAGVLSAYGIGLMRPEVLRQEAVQRPLEPQLLVDLQQRRQELLHQAERILGEAGDGAADHASARWSLELRPLLGERALVLPWQGEESVDDLQAAYGALHQQRHGYRSEGETLVVERLQLRIAAAALAPPPPTAEALPPDPAPPPFTDAPPTGAPCAGADPSTSGAALPPSPPSWVRLCLPRPPEQGSADHQDAPLVWHSVPCWRREQLRAGQRLQGPALVLESTGTTVLEPGWGGRVLGDGALLLEPLPAETGAEPNPAVPAAGDPPPAACNPDPAEPARQTDPVQLELYNHRFSAIAEQMGLRLQQSSRSVNIRERLDFSCALFDGAGRLVANAPHIPVHLGSMGESVAALLAAIARGEHPPLAPGDAVAANDPYAGGTHLPDITVITPVFPPAEPKVARPAAPVAFVACRGHHADVGGTTPGSMPPLSRSIQEEGLLLRNAPLVQGGRLDQAAWLARLRGGPHPVREPRRLLADLQAQVAANQLGALELGRLMGQRGAAEVLAFMALVQQNAAEAVRSVIDRLQEGSHRVELDDGAQIVVAIRPDRRRRRVAVDFMGTSPQQAGNLNAPLAITKAVVLYCFRLLVARPIPLNAGCFEPIDLIVPEGSLLRPTYPAAVVGGNVETSQAVANALLAALGVMAASQGTMNNLSFGNDRCQYYETVAGGTGAGVLADGNGFAGCSAVQSHMTNSRLTDPEILEARFPVRLERFALRRGSGGAGRWRGGDGVVRQLRFLEPLTLSILSGSRRVAPFGMAGGGPGQCGRNALQRGDGPWQELAGSAEVALEPGDGFRLETPGGGGWGP